MNLDPDDKQLDWFYTKEKSHFNKFKAHIDGKIANLYAYDAQNPYI